ncbi:hypothetical protein BC937DRAFT_92754 [Endogone sp. FLAS-F59071]|nr:hypothetical protein BC937DRAFT_92754 [Endogone sp. FLAS-F59071]|eukprot:RUS21419.1 hypothetical protein BC937DRAFT_92754 [Endogone sp. FLAS-F59071]
MDFPTPSDNVWLPSWTPGKLGKHFFFLSSDGLPKLTNFIAVESLEAADFVAVDDNILLNNEGQDKYEAISKIAKERNIPIQSVSSLQFADQFIQHQLPMPSVSKPTITVQEYWDDEGYFTLIFDKNEAGMEDANADEQLNYIILLRDPIVRSFMKTDPQSDDWKNLLLMLDWNPLRYVNQTRWRINDVWISYISEAWNFIDEKTYVYDWSKEDQVKFDEEYGTESDAIKPTDAVRAALFVFFIANKEAVFEAASTVKVDNIVSTVPAVMLKRTTPADSISNKVDFKCMFDENLLGIAQHLLDDPELRSTFQDPEFVYDVAMAGIRGSDDHTVAIDASKRRRMIITNDEDFALISMRNEFGMIILRGGVINEVNANFYTFRRLIKGEKMRLIKILLTSYSEDMQSIRNNGGVKIADLDGTCILTGKGKNQVMVVQNPRWIIRDVTDEDKKNFSERKLARIRSRQISMQPSHNDAPGAQAITTANPQLLTTDQNQTTLRLPHIDIPENDTVSWEGSWSTLSTLSPVTSEDFIVRDLVPGQGLGNQFLDNLRTANSLDVIGKEVQGYEALIFLNHVPTIA